MAADIGQNRIFGNQPRSRRRTVSSLDAPAPAARSKPASSREEIARRAYEIWLSKGCPHGHDVEHWLEAERQIRQQS